MKICSAISTCCLLLYSLSAVASEDTALWNFSFDHFTAFRDRPLFSPDRKPSSEPPVEQAIEPLVQEKVEAGSLKIQIVGVILPDQGSGSLLISEEGVDKVSLLTIGHSVQGWKLQRIEVGSAEFVRNSDKLSVQTPAGIRDRK